MTRWNTWYFSRRRENSRKGSSTVLVILIVIMLATLAILAVATTNSGYRLSTRLAERTAVFYRIESLAERSLYEVGRALRASAVGDKGSVTSGVESGLDATLGIRNWSREGDEIRYDVFDAETGRSVHLHIDVSDPHAIRILEWFENQREFELTNLEYGDVDDGSND